MYDMVQIHSITKTMFYGHALVNASQQKMLNGERSHTVLKIGFIAFKLNIKYYSK